MVERGKEVDLLRRECDRLRLQLAQCLSSCNSFEEIKELLIIIRRLEERIEALTRENAKLRERLQECKEARNN